MGIVDHIVVVVLPSLLVVELALALVLHIVVVELERNLVGIVAVIGADVVLASWGEGASCWGRSANLGDMSSWLKVPEEAWSSVPESMAI